MLFKKLGGGWEGRELYTTYAVHTILGHHVHFMYFYVLSN